MRFIRKLIMGVIIIVILVIGLVFVMRKIRPAETTRVDEPPSVFNDVRNKVGGVTTDTQNWTTSQLQSALAEFNSYLPTFHKAGFDVSEVRVEAGVFPILTATFTQVEAITVEKQNQVLKANKDKTILSYMLQSLFKVYSMHMGNYKLMSVDINLSLTPSTTLVLQPTTDDSKDKQPDPGQAKPDDAKPGQ